MPSSQQLTRLAALVDAPARKQKTSATVSATLLRVVDALAGPAQRSAWIERAVRAYARHQLRGLRRARELTLLNRHAHMLNAEGEDSAAYQAVWDAE